MKSKSNHNNHSNEHKGLECDCREYTFKNGQLVCKKCGKPMKNEQKPITSKGLRHKSGFYDK